MKTSRAGRRRVVHLVESLEPGGLERVVETLATHLDPERYEAEVWTFGRVGGVGLRLLERGVPVRRIAVPPQLRLRNAHALAALLRDCGAEVVHGHGYLPGALARWAGRLGGLKLALAHRHTTDEGEGFVQWLRERWLQRLGWTVCCSETVRLHAVRRLGIAPGRTRVVHNGVPLDVFQPAADRAVPPHPVILCVANLRPVKGHVHLLEAAAMLARGGRSFTVRLVGDGPERPALAERARALGIEDRVEFLGSRPDVARELRHAHIFVLPSVGREGLGLAALEAMATGLPVVASRLGGLREVVVHGRTGLLVPPGEPEGLARALDDLMRSPARALRMGREGRRRVEERFSATTMARRMERVYDEAGPEEDRTRRTPVLFLSQRGEMYGGGQVSLRNLVLNLDRRKFRPVVAVGSPGPLLWELSTAGIETWLLPLPPLRSVRWVRCLQAALRLRELARRCGVRIVHADSTRSAAYARCLPWRVRRVWSLRDVRPDPLDPFLVRGFHRLLPVAEAVARTRCRSASAGRVRIVPNGADVPAPAEGRLAVRARLGLPADAFVLLAVGRVEAAKGIHELLLALRRLKDECLAVHLVLAGPVDHDALAYWLERVRELELHDRVLFAGWREDLSDLRHASDCLVLASHYEAAPRSVLEAMAAQLPVVATNVGGVPEILGDAGRLVPPSDAEALAAAIRTLHDDPDLRRDLAARAHARWSRWFTLDAHVRAMEAVYEGLLPGPPDEGRVERREEAA